MYGARAFQAYEKASAASKNMSDLNYITNRMFKIKNGGDEAEARDILEVTPISQGNVFNQRDANWLNQLFLFGPTKERNDYMRMVISTLIEKRLSFVPGDLFAANLKKKMDSISYVDNKTVNNCAIASNPVIQISDITSDGESGREWMKLDKTKIILIGGLVTLSGVLVFMILRRRRIKRLSGR
jgi:hypothetical protein